jgi:hypothetical protein
LTLINYNKGDVVRALFPYREPEDNQNPREDGTVTVSAKYRPLLVMGVRQDSLICAFITSKDRYDTDFPILAKHFQEGGLNYDVSYLQPYTLYTLRANTVKEKLGTLKDEKIDEFTTSLVNLLQQPTSSKVMRRPRPRPKKPY